MRKGRNRSEGSIRSSKSDVQVNEEIFFPPLDSLTIKVISLRLNDEEPKHFAIKITFSDQLLLSGIIKSIGARDVEQQSVQVTGTMSYDPSDYERMCLLADCPLVASIRPLKNVEPSWSGSMWTRNSLIRNASSKSDAVSCNDISCCNVDILPLFIEKDILCVRKRMEPMLDQSVLHKKSWDNLPLLTMEISAIRNPLNGQHHRVLRDTNYMKLTLVGAYNTFIPFEDDFAYVAASKMPQFNETNSGLVTFNQGNRKPRRFRSTCFYPNWESLRIGDEIFSRDDEKFTCKLSELQNEENIDLKYYIYKLPSYYKAIWGSFHRTLILDNTKQWFMDHIRRFKWPFEVHIYGDNGGYSFMALLDLTKLLYPGENVVRMAVPLQWIDAGLMLEKCDCDLLLTSNDKPPSMAVATQKPSKMTTESAPTSATTDAGVIIRSTGSDENNAFIILEIKLAQPLSKAAIPPYISNTELRNMLESMEHWQLKRECSGRGQLDRGWQTTVRSAANSLRHLPYYGMTEICSFNRQLSETRTRVEILTSFWQDASVYINNNFVVQEYLESDEMFEELVMMGHVCLMRTAGITLAGVDNLEAMDPTLRAARHAKQMQDFNHAMDLYLQLVVQNPLVASYWRELGVCMRDIDSEWAKVCVAKSIELDPRDPLTLLLQGSMVFEEDPTSAEPFFLALLALHPFWFTAWTITSIYYVKRELYHMADKIIECNKRCRIENLNRDFANLRSWEQELGVWWDQTPLLPGMSKYYEAADVLLRIRSILLAETCLARALEEAGESAAYFHLLALCCRLRGQIDEALCHIRLGIKKFGEISYLRSLEAECYHKKNECEAAMASFQKAGSCVGPYSVMLSMPCRERQRVSSILVDLVRRQPSAYSWTSLAEDWISKASVGEAGDAGVSEEQATARACSAACLVQALKWDRRAGRAWALLAGLVKPSARRLHCIHMATSCGYEMEDKAKESNSSSKQSRCHLLGTALTECRCKQNLIF